MRNRLPGSRSAEVASAAGWLQGTRPEALHRSPIPAGTPAPTRGLNVELYGFARDEMEVAREAYAFLASH